MKKILSVTLAIALVFALIACEASSPSYFGKKVMSVTVASAPAYFEGETIDPADIELKIVYDTNATATVNAAEVGMVPAENGDWKADENSTAFTLKYGTDSGLNGSGEVQTWKISVPTQTLSKLVIDTTNAVKEISVVTSGIDYDKLGLVFNAQYAGGSKVVDYATASDLVTGLTIEPETADIEYGVPVAMKVTPADKASFSAEWTVTVIENPAYQLDHFELRWNNEQEIFAVDGGKYINGEGTAVAATLADVDFDLYAVMKAADENGDTAHLVPTTEWTTDEESATTGKLFVDFIEYALSQPLNDTKVNNFKAVVIAKGAAEDGSDVEYTANSLAIAYTDDYVKTFSVDGSKVTCKPGDPINESAFTITAESWASGYEYDGEGEASKNTLTPTYFEIKPDKVKEGFTGSELVITDVTVKSTAPVSYQKAVWDEVEVKITVDQSGN